MSTPANGDNGEPLEGVLLDDRPRRGDMEMIIDTVQAGAWPDSVDPEQLYSRVIPAGATGEILDLERYLPAPRRARGAVITQTVDDFARYVNRHDSDLHTTVWVDADKHLIIGVLDDHAADYPAWGQHRALLQLKPTDAWKHWIAKDGVLMSQEQFAEHIEDGLPEIVTPDGATMLELAQSIQGTTKAEFQSAHRLSNGTIGVKYVEEHSAAAGQKGELEIPERFELAISPFLGEEAYRVRARLRYRLRSGALTIGYRLDRPGDVVRDAIDHIADRLSSRFPGDRVFIGQPRS